jgi:hypothetical protein
VRDLAAPEFYGRGYVNDGHRLAATYIAKEFKEIGLRSFGNGYFQEFPISVNTFPEEATLIINKKALVPGTDFMVSPCSNTLKGKYKTFYLSAEVVADSEKLLNCLAEAEDKILYIDQTAQVDSSQAFKDKFRQGISFLSTFRNNPAVGIILATTDKLTWHIAQQPCPIPQYIVRKEALAKPPEKVELAVVNKYEPEINTQNVIGLLPGKNPEASVVVISAHYDHLGMMGNKTYFPGANDNASGVAMMLSLARHFKENQPDVSLLFIAFGAEEVGLLGSSHYVNHPLVPLEKTRFVLNLDITGTGEEGIKVVNGKVFTDKFNQLESLNSQNGLLSQVSARGEACNSDHCLFYKQGIPSFFIYTLGGIKAYHDPLDKSETLPLTAFPQLFALLSKFVPSL